MDKIYDKVVKKKRLQRLGENRVLLIPKPWIESLDWTQETELILEYHPHQKKIIISENGKEVSDTIRLAD